MGSLTAGKNNRSYTVYIEQSCIYTIYENTLQHFGALAPALNEDAPLCCLMLHTTITHMLDAALQPSRLRVALRLHAMLILQGWQPVA